MFATLAFAEQRARHPGAAPLFPDPLARFRPFSPRNAFVRQNKNFAKLLKWTFFLICKSFPFRLSIFRLMIWAFVSSNSGSDTSFVRLHSFPSHISIVIRLESFKSRNVNGMNGAPKMANHENVPNIINSRILRMGDRAK